LGGSQPFFTQKDKRDLVYYNIDLYAVQNICSQEIMKFLAGFCSCRANKRRRQQLV